MNKNTSKPYLTIMSMPFVNEEQTMKNNKKEY